MLHLIALSIGTSLRLGTRALAARSLGRGRGVAVRSALTAVATALVGGLVGLHAVLLWQRVASRTLLEPQVALRWIASLLILAGLLRLCRAGVPLLWGRKALGLWLTVLLLHLSFALPGAAEEGSAVDLRPGTTLLFVIPAPAILAFALGLVFSLAAGAFGSTPGLPKRTPGRRIGQFRLATLLACCPNLLSRPPPA